MRDRRKPTTVLTVSTVMALAAIALSTVGSRPAFAEEGENCGGTYQPICSSKEICIEPPFPWVGIRQCIKTYEYFRTPGED
jgi:hypothetical protein